MKKQNPADLTKRNNEARKKDIAKLRESARAVPGLLNITSKHELALMELTERVRAIEAFLRREFGSATPKKLR